MKKVFSAPLSRRKTMTNDTQSQDDKTRHAPMTVEQLKAIITGGKATLLDVRRKTDYEAAPAKIPGAVWRDPERVDQWRGELPADGTTVIYCVRGGSVSQSVCQQLKAAGLEATYLDGGIKAWTDQGGEVE
jgi:rhodanese-related sulfurtransferase